MSAYRTPAPLLSRGLLWPASDTLHHTCRRTSRLPPRPSHGPAPPRSHAGPTWPRAGRTWAACPARWLSCAPCSVGAVSSATPPRALSRSRAPRHRWPVPARSQGHAPSSRPAARASSARFPACRPGTRVFGRTRVVRNHEAAMRFSSEAPRLRGSEAPRLRGSEAPRLRGSEAPRLRGSEAPRLRGSEAPRQRAHSNERLNDRVPARVTTTSDRDHRPARGFTGAETGKSVALLLRLGHVAARSTTPCGTSAIVTIRHRAMSSLRARATIRTVLRTPRTPVRVRYHWARALSFWNSRNC